MGKVQTLPRKTSADGYPSAEDISNYGDSDLGGDGSKFPGVKFTL